MFWSKTLAEMQTEVQTSKLAQIPDTHCRSSLITQSMTLNNCPQVKIVKVATRKSPGMAQMMSAPAPKPSAQTQAMRHDPWSEASGTLSPIS